MEIAQLLPPQPFDFDPVLEFEAELEQGARELDLEPYLVQRLKHAEREITVNIPAAGEGGTALNIAGYRIQHSNIAGPCIGPVTIRPTSHPAELRLTAATITLQCLLLGLRLGGAAGAIVCDKSRLGEEELRRTIDGYVCKLRDCSGAELDVFAPEGAEWLVRCMRTAAYRARGHHTPAAIVGDRRLGAAAAAAILAVIRRALNVEDLTDVRVAIQGFSQWERVLAESLQREDARIVGVADRSGALMRADGLDLAELGAYADDTGVLFGCPNADAATNADLLESSCDVLLLAAAPQQIGPHNAAHVRARTIVELTANAIAVPSDRFESEHVVIPFHLSGCAQLAVWAYEWRQGLSYSDVSCRQAADDACTRMLAAYELVNAIAERREIDLRHATVLAALERFKEALRP